MPEKKGRRLKVALVDEFLTVDGGAQRVLKVLHDMWTEAPVYTMNYFPERFNPALTDWDIRTSWVSKLPFSRGLEQQYKLFYPFAVEMFDFSDYDLVISITYAGYSKAIIVPPDCLHISYVQTVPRYLWGYRTSAHERVGWLYKKIILPPLEHYWRIWDRQSSVRPNVLLANSHNIARRIEKAYRRESTVLYPPADISDLLSTRRKGESSDYFIYFGRLEKYKCVDMAIRACVSAKRKLKIVGRGLCERELKRLVAQLGAEGLVEFTGWISDEARNSAIASARAFIFPGPDEDFGLVMVEALAAGVPVVAFSRGGAAEIIDSSRIGVLVDDFSQIELDCAVASFDPKMYSSEACRKRAQDFSVDVFKRNLLRIVDLSVEKLMK